MPKRTPSFRKCMWIPPGKSLEHDPVTHLRLVRGAAAAQGISPDEWNRAARRSYASFTKKKARAQARRAK